MKVLFKKHVVNVGKVGEVKEVKPGYAQNFLFPQGHAVEYTPQIAKSIKMSQRKDEAHRRDLLENRYEIAETLNGKELHFHLKTWASDKVYGWIGEKDILEAIKKEFKTELSKKHVELHDGHLKRLWSHDVFIKVWKDAMAKMTVHLHALES